MTTAGEAPELVRETVRSVLAQRWPADRLWVIVSDDAHSDAMSAVVDELRAESPEADLSYHRPARRGTPERRGEAKAGNLNSRLRPLRASGRTIDFFETRDADDEVGDPTFLSQCVAQMRTDERLAYVQTIKDGRVSRGDPFDNRQLHFFQAAMASRQAANAVFPCGSGVVWRRAALDDLGGFPAWNLVEDLQSGFDALRRGWHGAFLPIVGAYAQHAPEDIPNVYKQRGTWALDTVRLVFWSPMAGLDLRQRLQFIELALFYAQGIATLVFILNPVFGFLWQLYPLESDVGGYLLHFWPFAIGLELLLALFNRPHSYESLWRARQLWAGLAPVYARATVLGIVNGPERKPVYRVTRKSHAFAWYWRETLPQAALLLLLAASGAYSLATHGFLTSFDLGSAYWSALYVLLMGGFLRRSWFGARSPLAGVGERLSRAHWLRPATSLAAGLAAGAVAVAAVATNGAFTPVALAAGAVGIAATAAAAHPRVSRSVPRVAGAQLAATAGFLAGLLALVSG